MADEVLVSITEAPTAWLVALAQHLKQQLRAEWTPETDQARCVDIISLHEVLNELCTRQVEVPDV